MSLTKFNLLAVFIAVALVEVTHCSSVATFDAFEVIQAESYNYTNESLVCHDCTDQSIYYTCFNYRTSVLGYEGVDFGTGAVRVDIRASNWQSGGDVTVDFHLGDPQSTPFASLTIPVTSERCSWTTVSTMIQAVPIGVRDVYLTFTSLRPGMLADVDWFQFSATSGNATIYDPFDIMQAENNSRSIISYKSSCPPLTVDFMTSNVAGSVFGYYGVNFKNGAQAIQIRLAAWDSGTIYLHLDSPSSGPMAIIPVQKIGPTKDPCSFYLIEQFVWTVPVGVHDLYFTFELPSAVSDFVNIDWFTFKAAS